MGFSKALMSQPQATRSAPVLGRSSVRRHKSFRKPHESLLTPAPTVSVAISLRGLGGPAPTGLLLLWSGTRPESCRQGAAQGTRPIDPRQAPNQGGPGAERRKDHL